jgi:hypothetical protein
MALTKASLIDINGQELILDADADTSITADTDDRIDLRVAGSDVGQLGVNYFNLQGQTGTSMELKLSTSDGSVGGYLYGEATEIGFLDKDGHWAIRHDGDNFTSFAINNSEKMRLDSSGRLGIGLTSPQAVLDVVSSGATSTAFRVLKSGTSTQNLHAMTEISGHGRLSIYDSSENEDIRFDSNGNSYLNGGNVGIGTSSPGYFVHFNASSGGTQFQKQGGGPNLYEAWTNTGGTNFIGTNGTQWEFYVGSTLKFQINSSGGASVSDEKFKENIEDISYGLDTVKTLKPRKFKWKDSQENDIGFIAQEVKPIINEIINEPLESPEGLENGMSMNYSALTAVLTKAIQELSAKVEELESKIDG